MCIFPSPLAMSLQVWRPFSLIFETRNHGHIASLLFTVLKPYMNGYNGLIPSEHVSV